MSWAELFERAADCAVTEDQVRERLAARRGETDSAEAEEGNGA